MLNLFLALVVNSFSHEETPVSQQGEKVISRMLKAAASLSFSVVNVLKRSQIHPKEETSCDSVREKKGSKTTGISDNFLNFLEPTESINEAYHSVSGNENAALEDCSETLSGWKKYLGEFRSGIAKVVQSKFFEWFILFIITISSICLVSLCPRLIERLNY